MLNGAGYPAAVLGLLTHWTAPEADALFTAALTRRVYLDEQRESGHDHEALEWLGDRALNLAVAQELWRRFPFAAPGALDLARRELSSEPILAKVGRDLSLGRFIRMGVGERQEGQADTPASLSSHVEALIGAALLAGGHAGAEALVMSLLEGEWPAELSEVSVTSSAASGNDVLSELNLLGQQRWRGVWDQKDGGVRWELERGGPDHQPWHIATVTLPDGRSFTGERVAGKSKKAKESAAVGAVGYLRGLLG